jgi:site-specific recombinase XerD
MAKIVRKKGKFIVDYRIGETRSRPSFDTKAEAMTFKQELLLRMAQLPEIEKRREEISIADAIRKYAEVVTIHKSEVTQGQEKLYFTKLYDYLCDHEKVFLLRDVTILHLEHFQSKLRKQVSGSTVNRHFNTYKNFFNKCEQWELIERTPAKRITRMPEDPKERKLWTQAQMEGVIAELPQWAGDVLFFIAVSTVRPGKEVERICWGDVNFDLNVVRVKAYKGRGELRERFIPMPPNLVEFLLEKKKRSFRTKPTDFVFTNSIGNPVRGLVLAKLVKDACKTLCYEGLAPYGLRHTAFTDLAVNEANLEKIRMLGGHSAITTTQRYLKMNVEQLRGAMDLTKSRNLTRSSGH